MSSTGADRSLRCDADRSESHSNTGSFSTYLSTKCGECFPELLLEHVATISANQCYGNTGHTCTTQYTYSVTATGLCGAPTDPCNDGGICHAQDQTAVCKVDGGSATQRCCCDATGKNCTFRRDAVACPTPTDAGVVKKDAASPK